MRRFEEDPGNIWYAAAALLLLVVFGIVVGWTVLKSIGLTLNCGAIFSASFLLGLLYVAIRPFLKNK